MKNVTTQDILRIINTPSESKLSASVREVIRGSGGGKGGSKTPKEAPNTLQSQATIKIVEAISEGPIKGFPGDAQAIRFDKTPVQNLDGSFNFEGIKFEYRLGTPDQDYMPGFPGAESVSAVNTEIKFAKPVIRTVSSSTVDAVRVVLRLPQALTYMDTKSGDLNGYRVGIAIDTRPTGGTWIQVLTDTIQGKTITAYEEAYRIEKPVGATGTWDIRVRRTNQESTVATTVDRIDWFTTTEIIDIKIAYENAAVAGIAVSAESTGGNVPVRSYLVDGLVIKVPTNYTPTVYNNDGTVASYASYSGTWDGVSFKYSWTDDPAWIVYDLLTNTRYGAGDYVDEGIIDQYSFYEASKYNCELIDPEQNGQLRPRFTCNMSIMTREDAWKMIEAVAGTCAANVAISPGSIRLMQDRPQLPIATINNAMVYNGEFTYTGIDLASRTTAVKVTFNNAADGWLPNDVLEVAPQDYIDRYGYNEQSISALGVTNESQARTMAKWVIESTMSPQEIVDFKVSVGGVLSFQHGDVINIVDNFYVNSQMSGMVKDATSVSNYFNINLDRMLYNIGTSTPISNGSQMKIQLRTGQEIIGTLSSIVTSNVDPVGGIGSVQARWTPAAGQPAVTVDDLVNTPFIIVSVVQPRQFKIMSIAKDSTGVWSIQGVHYDIGKYARVEQGIVIPQPPFSVVDSWVVGQPQNLTFVPETYINPQGIVRMRLSLDWDDVAATGLVPIKGYRVRIRRENNPYEWTEMLNQSEHRIDDAIPGVYEVSVYAYNARGIQSPALNGYFTLQTYEGEPSPLPTPSGFELIGGGTAFTGTNFTIKWNPVVSTTAATLKDYKITFYTDADSEVYTMYQTGTQLLIDRSQIIAWYGSAVRSIKISVNARDTLERLSLPVTATFTNAAPAAITGLSLTPGFTEYWVSHNQLTDMDLAGVYVWHSTTSGFTPSIYTLAASDIAYSTEHLVVAESDTQYYVRVAAYDTWSDQGLNISSELSVKTNSNLIGIVLDAPTGLTASSTIYTTDTGVELASMVVQWNNTPHAIGYVLEIVNLTTGDASWPAIGQSPAGGTTSHTFDAIPGNQYRFRVKATASTSESPWTAPYTITAAADTVGPTAPTTLVVTPAYSAMSLNWTNPPDEDLVAIEIYRRTTGSGNGTLITTINSSQAVALTSYYDANLTIGNKYAYRVRGIDRSGNFGDYSNWSILQTVANVPTGSINGESIAAGSVGESQIMNDAITAAKILNGAVGSAELANLAVIADKIANGAVGTNQIANGGITETKIGDNSISTRTIIANAVVASTIAAGAVVADKIAASAITTDKIAAGAVTADTIAANAITANKIAADAITANHLSAGSVTADAIAANSVSTDALQAGSVTAGIIAANAVTATKIQANAITSTHIGANTIITNQANIGNAVVGTAAIIDGVITNAKIANATIESAKFAGQINSDNYVAGNSGWMIRRDTGAAEFGNINARGILKTGTSGQRVEVGNDAGFLMWAGNGVKNTNNAQFYIDTSGNAVFKGDVTANTITGNYQRVAIINWGGTVGGGSSAFTEVTRFTLDAPFKAGEYHTPIFNLACFVGSQSDNGVIRMAYQRLDGSTWTTITEYQVNKGGGVGSFEPMPGFDSPRNAATTYRIAIRNVQNGQRLVINGVIGTIYGIK